MMDFRAQNPHVNRRLKVSHECEFRLPPVGITATRYILGGRTYEKFTLRCDAQNCWLVVDSLPSEAHAKEYLAAHKAGDSNFIDHCPAPPKRESLPSGLSNVEKLWRELDDVVEGLATAQSYRGMTAEQMRGYAKGISFSIVMIEPSAFPTIEEVSRHARDRRRMRLGEIEWSATPTSLKHNATVMEVKGLHDAGPKAGAPKPKSSPKQTELSEQIKLAIIAGVRSGMFTVDEMAETYRVSLDTVRALVG